MAKRIKIKSQLLTRKYEKFKTKLPRLVETTLSLNIDSNPDKENERSRQDWPVTKVNDKGIDKAAKIHNIIFMSRHQIIFSLDLFFNSSFQITKNMAGKPPSGWIDKVAAAKIIGRYFR